MALTVGTGPFGHQPAGRSNFEAPERVLYFEDSPRRIRAVFAGETVVDCKRVKLLHETGCLPVYYFPEADVRMDLLVRSGRATRSPLKGELTARQGFAARRGAGRHPALAGPVRNRPAPALVHLP